MELSSKLLSQCGDDTAQLTRLIKLLTQIRSDLNRRKMCMLQGIRHIFDFIILRNYAEKRYLDVRKRTKNNCLDSEIWFLSVIISMRTEIYLCRLIRPHSRKVIGEACLIFP